MARPAALSARSAAVGVLEPVSPREWRLRAQQALALPLAFTLALVAGALFPAVRQNPKLLLSMCVAGAVLLLWNALRLALALRCGRCFTLAIVLRKQHYVQACAQGSVLLYWGWYWRLVYASAPLIVAQLLFAYAFDMLLAWSRRDRYVLGFGPFPVIFSINLFLWFKPDWFYLQFLMVAVGFAAKELITWTKDGRRAHIFNPSSFPLGVFSLALIATGSTQMTYGQEIALTQTLPPNIYLFLFLIGLPGQLFFGVTSMTMSAVVTTYVFGLLYYAATGVYYFFDSYLPVAVFLGMHLLFTDPSTSPRTELGRVLFGVLYGLGVIAFEGLLAGSGIPTFYDKLLPVPILNLTIKLIDAAAQSKTLRRFDPAALGRSLTGTRRNLAYMTTWAVVFVIMTAAQGVGNTHRGHWIPFWQDACREGRRNACRNLALMEATTCNNGSGWACNEFGLLLAQRRYVGAGVASALDRRSHESFRRACELGFSLGCENLRMSAVDVGSLQSGPPQLSDYRIVLREGQRPVPDSAVELYQRACRQGFTSACENPAGTAR